MKDRDEIDREHMLFIKRCQQLCDQAGEKIPQLIFETAMGFGWEVGTCAQLLHEGGSEEELSTAMKSLTENAAEMQIVILAAIDYFGLDTEQMSKHIEEQLGMN